MNLVIISGLSGSGKTIALHTLEDIGYYCTDNLPIGLLDAFVLEFSQPHLARVKKVAVGIDARSSLDQIGRFPALIAGCRRRYERHSAIPSSSEMRARSLGFSISCDTSQPP